MILNKFIFIYLLYINSSFIYNHQITIYLITYFHILIKKFIKKTKPNQKLIKIY